MATTTVTGSDVADGGVNDDTLTWWDAPAIEWSHFDTIHTSVIAWWGDTADTNIIHVPARVRDITVAHEPEAEVYVLELPVLKTDVHLIPTLGLVVCFFRFRILPEDGPIAGSYFLDFHIGCVIPLGFYF